MPGLALVGAGVAFLTLNERRDVAQARLRVAAELVALSLEETDVECVDRTLDGRLLHYQGMLLPEDAPADEDLGVSNAQLLMLKRTVAMQQWRETPVVTSDGKGGKSTTYAYERVWSTHEERAEHSPDHVNPKFPSGLPGGVREFQPTRMLLGTEDKLALNADLVKQVVRTMAVRYGCRVLTCSLRRQTGCRCG